ncbi:MAG: putative sugar nucleotidyl transferase [Stygiobacter sp.]|uniref:Sugar nucleotidyl transferase n=1 Tax=Stygiobacter electus TaxID=3032292 RepID=A0AAE3P0E0_9BACT|nr:putative sugar nucleotidyl transferase [Stygiobacter electus]MDF1611407.1 putative sugar nucleotidyl transferase [Stygiobacter electus]
MKNNICIFEDNGFNELLPLTYLRTTFQLKCGILSLLDKIKIHFGRTKYYLIPRIILVDLLKKENENVLNKSLPNEDLLFINGRILINETIKKLILELKVNEVLKHDNNIIAAFISKDNISNIKFDKNGLPDFSSLKLNKQLCDNFLITYPWELVNNNSQEIINDFEKINKSNKSTKKFSLNSFVNKKDIFISSTAKVSSFVFFDASDGPILIDDNALILPHTYLKGPIYIGKNTLVKANSSIYHGTSIGEFCKVGGEIEESIIHSYSNKQHDGFLGHSYLAQWINLGAGTNNSDLKNNYSKISVLLNGKNVFTNSQFVGAIIGDHTKTSINTKINTGSIFGVACNIFTNDFPPKYLPSFSWCGKDKVSKYEFNKFLETAKVVMKRRNINISEAQIKLLKIVYEESTLEKTDV